MSTVKEDLEMVCKKISRVRFELKLWYDRAPKWAKMKYEFEHFVITSDHLNELYIKADKLVKLIKR